MYYYTFTTHYIATYLAENPSSECPSQLSLPSSEILTRSALLRECVNASKIASVHVSLKKQYRKDYKIKCRFYCLYNSPSRYSRSSSARVSSSSNPCSECSLAISQYMCVSPKTPARMCNMLQRHVAHAQYIYIIPQIFVTSHAP